VQASPSAEASSATPSQSSPAAAAQIDRRRLAATASHAKPAAPWQTIRPVRSRALAVG
jgi:hypothetical protein